MKNLYGAIRIMPTKLQGALESGVCAKKHHCYEGNVYIGLCHGQRSVLNILYTKIIITMFVVAGANLVINNSFSGGPWFVGLTVFVIKFNFSF